jgi:cytochrome P450
MYMVLLLIFAGTETFSTILSFVLLILLKYPDILGEYDLGVWGGVVIQDDGAYAGR